MSLLDQVYLPDLEKRNIYKGYNYRSFLNSNVRRNIHIRVDIFSKARTNIYDTLKIKWILKNILQKFYTLQSDHMMLL